MTPTDEHHAFDISEFLSAERTILDTKLNFSLLSGKAAFAGTGSRDRLALGEDRLAAHRAPDVIDHLDKGRAADEPRIILVKAGLDDLLDMFFHGNSAKCWKTTPR